MNKYYLALILSIVHIAMQAQFYVVDTNGDVVYSQEEGLPAYITLEKPIVQQEEPIAIDLGLKSEIIVKSHGKMVKKGMIGIHICIVMKKDV